MHSNPIQETLPIKSQQELRNIDNITLHNIALGRTHSKMQLHVKQFHGHHSLGDVDNSPTIDKIEVDVNTIDEVAKNIGIKAINFLKIDVEGFESDVLHGAENLLKNKKIEYILFELQDSILQSINRTSSEVFEIIFNAGYQIIDLNGNMQKDNNKTIPNGDYLACLDGSETAKKLAGSEFDLI